MRESSARLVISALSWSAGHATGRWQVLFQISCGFCLPINICLSRCCLVMVRAAVHCTTFDTNADTPTFRLHYLDRRKRVFDIKFRLRIVSLSLFRYYCSHTQDNHEVSSKRNRDNSCSPAPSHLFPDTAHAILAPVSAF